MIPENIRLKLRLKDPKFKTCNLSTATLDDDDIIELVKLIQHNSNIKVVMLKRGLNLDASTIDLVKEKCPGVSFLNLNNSLSDVSHVENQTTTFEQAQNSQVVTPRRTSSSGSPLAQLSFHASETHASESMETDDDQPQGKLTLF